MKEHYLNKNIDIIAAFLSEDVDHIKDLGNKYHFPFQIAMVAEATKKTVVRKLDIISADRFPNTFLVRRDGTIAWSVYGFPLRVRPGSLPYLSSFGLRCQIFRCDVEAGYRAFKNNNLKSAQLLFSGPFITPVQNKRKRSRGSENDYKWTASQYHGRESLNY